MFWQSRNFDKIFFMHVYSSNGRSKIALSKTSQLKHSYYNIYDAGLWWGFFFSFCYIKGYNMFQWLYGGLFSYYNSGMMHHYEISTVIHYGCITFYYPLTINMFLFYHDFEVIQNISWHNCMRISIMDFLFFNMGVPNTNKFQSLGSYISLYFALHSS